MKFFCLCMSPAIDATVKLPHAPKVDVVDTTAAGDTLLAEWCWRRFGEDDFSRVERAERVVGGKADAQWAVAAGSAACTMPGGAPPAASLVDGLFKKE